MKVPNEYRVKDGPYGSNDDLGNNGMFILKRPNSRNDLRIIASDGMGWEHVSVSKKYECPTWEEMCLVKRLFWDDKECIVQFHPPQSDYVNNHNFCLHLWKPINQVIPIPDSFLVGVK